MANPDKLNPFGKAKAGETAKQKADRQKKFYSFQRNSAQERGDQKTVNKIYSKMGKKSPDVDADLGNKAILGAVPVLAGGANAARSLLTRAAGTAGKAIASGVGGALAKRGGAMARSAGSALVKDAERGAPASTRALSSGSPKARPPAQKMLASGAKSTLKKSNLSSTAARQAGKAKFSEAGKTGRRTDNYVRSKAGIANKQAAKSTKGS